jgi:hypothetical protein
VKPRTLLVFGFAALLGCTRAGAIDDAPGQPLGAGWEKGLSPKCTSLYSQSWTPVRGADKTRPSPAPKPVQGKDFSEPTFKTCMVRISDHAADQVPGFARNDYSRRQPFNADDTKIVVAAQDGSWHLYDVPLRRYIGKLDGVGGDAEPQWHPTNPNLLYYFPAYGIGMQIKEIDVVTGKSRVAADLAARIKAIWPKANSAWTKSEGSPSQDLRYWGLMVDDADWQGLGMLTYDLTEDKIIATYDYKKNGRGRPDHVSMSLTGAYVTGSWGDGTFAFPRDFSTSLKLHKKSEHSDLALDANGEDTYVSVDYDMHGGPVFMMNMKTGARTNLFPLYIDKTATAIHFSGRATKKPGWVLVSTYGETKEPWQWLHGKVFAMELKEKPRIAHLAHHHSLYNEYFTEPHAAINRDFTRAVFGSNWDTKSKSDIDTYMIEIPAGITAPR